MRCVTVALAAAVLHGVAAQVPYYADEIPPQPFVAVNSTWDTSGFDATLVGKPLPTGQWWVDFATPQGRNSSAVNILPLLARRSACGVDVGYPETKQENINRRMRTPFATGIRIRVNEDVIDERCTTTVADYTDFSVQLKHRIIGGTLLGQSLETIFMRGSPYILLKSFGATPHFSIPEQIDTISKIKITAPVDVEASLLNITTQSGQTWMIQFPAITKMKVDRFEIKLDPSFANTTDYVKIMYVPASGKVNDLGPASRTLIEHSDCAVVGGAVSSGLVENKTFVSTKFRWTTLPGAPKNCKPLMLTNGMHRANWEGGWKAPSPPVLLYETVLGPLLPALGDFEMRMPVAKDLLEDDAEKLQLSEKFWLYSQALRDRDTYLGKIKEDSDNATGTAAELPARAAEFYGLAKLYRIARRLDAVKLGLEVSGRMNTLLDKMVNLVAYDSTFGGYIPSPPGRLLSEPVTDNYEDQTKVYSQILYGFGQLYDVPPAEHEEQKKKPYIPRYKLDFVHAILRSVMTPNAGGDALTAGRGAEALKAVSQSAYYPPLRNFDWYSGMSMKGGLVYQPDAGRVVEAPSYGMLCWHGARHVGKVLLIPQAEELAGVLYATETAATKAFWIAEGGGVTGVTGLATIARDAFTVDTANTLVALEPLGDHQVPLLPVLREEVDKVQRVRVLLSTPPERAVTYEYAQFMESEALLAAMANGTHITRYIERSVKMNSTLTLKSAMVLEWAILTADPYGNRTQTDLFDTWEGKIPFRVEGRQLWYNTSFNYQVRSVTYIPAVIGRDPTETNVYGEYYEDILNRDLARIQDMGFNMIKIRWFHELSLHALRPFFSRVRDFDLGVIVSFTATKDQILNNRHITEQRLVDMMEVLGKEENLLIWNLESPSFAEISVTNTYQYMTMFRQLSRLRNKFDLSKRPLMLSLYPFFFGELITGGQNPVDIYSTGVELIEMQTNELNLTDTKLKLAKVTHPVLIDLVTDSFHGIKEEQDMAFRSKLLVNMSKAVLDLHRTHDTCGVGVTEWVDQYWRGETSNNDNDCPDPSPGRLSPCATRIIDFNDGEINSEHQGLNSQLDTWMKHCIRPKESFFAIGAMFDKNETELREKYDHLDCKFLFLETFWQWVVGVGSLVVLFFAFVLAFAAFMMRRAAKHRAETRGAQTGTRWCQPDIQKISRTIVKRTCTLVHTQKAFERIAVQGHDEHDKLRDREVTPMSGEWCGEVLWSVGEEVKEITLQLQFSSMPNNVGFTIQGTDSSKKYRILGTARKYTSQFLHDTNERGEQLVGERHLIDFTANNIAPEEDEDGDENLEFVGVWEKYRCVNPETGETTCYEYIEGGDEYDFEDLESGCRMIDSLSAPRPEFSGSFHIEPQPEVDPWNYNRWQCLLMQLERLQMLIYDEMLCQMRWGTEQKHQETDAAFDFAVDTLHYRYMHNFHGWVKQQNTVGGIVDIPDVHSRKRPDEQLGELLGLLTLWQIGEHNTWFAGHWLSWNLHYFLKFKKFPPQVVMSDPRHFCETPLTFDDINESCCLMPYWDVPHVCNNKCSEECERAAVEEGRRPPPKLLQPDGTYDEEEQQSYPFFKTFREPRRWGVLFFMLHDAYFILHTTVLAFFFWGLTMHFSDVGESTFGAVLSRSSHVYSNKETEANFIILTMCKVDFWLLVLHELLDIWIVSGVIQSPALGVLGTRFCQLIGALFCWCRCCIKGEPSKNTDDRDITCQTFFTSTTFKRVRIWDWVRLRWSAYLSIIVFAALLGSTLFGDDSDPDTKRMTAYAATRVSGLLLFNILVTVFPVTLPGTPETVKAAEVSTGKTRKTIVALFFWGIIYGLAFCFQGYIMFKSEGTGFDFCDCNGLDSETEYDGASAFIGDLGTQIMRCGRDQPRCFTAVVFIWLSTACIFALSVQGGFLLGVVFVGGIKHLLLQWETRKSRQIKGHKMETKFILSAINVKLLTFSDPRDNQLARRVWNKVISVMHEEDLLNNYECETLQIYTHTVDLAFQVENAFAKERISGFLEYITTSTNYEESLGPVQCYPAVTVIVPVYGEGVMADRNLLRIKARSDTQQMSQLHFLVENYRNEWENFVERCINEEGMFKKALDLESLVATLQDKNTLKQEFDYVKKRALKPDENLRKVCAQRILDMFHTRPRSFPDEEYNAIWWWASMRMQTVARTIRGVERQREAWKFLLELEADYTQSPKLTETYIDIVTTDKLQVIIAFQNLANNKWYDANKDAISMTWSKFPKFQVVYDIVTGDFRMAPDVYSKTTHKMRELWDCMENASCLAVWDAAAGDWHVDRVVGRRNKLRMAKNDNVKWSLPGAMQGKAVNQAHCLPFARGQIVQAVDCNQDGYFEESLKLRTLLGKFFPTEDRRWSSYKVVGHPEYVMSLTSGTIGRYAGYAEYIFNTMFQRVLSVLGARMHYGHPDYFDASWVVTQSGLSKPNPRTNLNEDIFAGYHIKAQAQHVLHIDDIKSGKGRETNFDGAMSFEHKLGMGAAMQFRTRDVFELSRYSNILDRHSIIFGSIAAYVYGGLVFFQIFISILLHVALAVAGKTDYDLLSEGSPYGSEWMVQMTLVEGLPLLVQLVLDFGLWGLFQWAWDIGGVTWFYMYVFMTKYQAFWHSVFDGNAVYVATGRSDPLFRRSFRHMWRMYGHSHTMYGALLLAIVIMYVSIHPRGSWPSFVRTIFHWLLAFGLILTPCSQNPSQTVSGLIKDLVRFVSWAFGEAIMKVKNTESFTGKPQKKVDRGAMIQLFNKMCKHTRKENRRAEGTSAPDEYSEEEWEEYEETESTSEDSTVIDDGGNLPGLKFGNKRGSQSTRSDTDTTSTRSTTASSRSGGKKPFVPKLGGVAKAQSEGSTTSSTVSSSDIGEGKTQRDQGGAAPITRRMKGVDHDERVDDLTQQDFLDRGVSQHQIDMLEKIFDKLDLKLPESQCDGYLSADLILKGFMYFGVRAQERDIVEHLNALQIASVNFWEFCLLYFIMQDSNSQLGSYGIQQAIENLPADKLEQVVHKQDERRKSVVAGRTDVGKSKDGQAEAYIQFAFNLRRSDEVKTIHYYDSTHFLDRIRAESLLHHYKISLILEYRGTSTTGRFLYAAAMMAGWCFVYFALWQDIIWEVLYLLLFFAWEYVVCLPDVVPVVILARCATHIWVVFRLLMLLGSGYIFQTLFMTYWFIHALLHLTLSFWAAYGPYLVGRGRFKKPQIEAQREECLIMLLKSSRERFLFAFPYYMFMRRVVAVVMVLFQFFYCLLLLLFFAILRLITWLFWNIGGYFKRKNATSTTYVAARTAEDMAEDAERREALSFDMQTQTAGVDTRSTQVGDAVESLACPGASKFRVGSCDPCGSGTPVPNTSTPKPLGLDGPTGPIDPEEWPADWLNLAFPKGKPAPWLPKALNGELLPVDWLEIANNGDAVPPEWLDFAPPTKDQPWEEAAPPGWPEMLSWPPPRPKGNARERMESEIPAEWLNVLLQDSEPEPEFLKLALNNDLDPVDWLRLGTDDDLDPDWIKMAPEPGADWGERKPRGWKEDVPWPPPKPKSKPYDELPNAWLKPMVDGAKGPEGDSVAKRIIGHRHGRIAGIPRVLPADILKLALPGGDPSKELSEEWEAALPENNRGMWAEAPPKNFPPALQWPPPRAKAVPDDLPIDWLNTAFKRGFDDDHIDQIRAGDEMDPTEWLQIAFGPDKEVPEDCLAVAPPPGGSWPEAPPASYPGDAPWPPPKPAGYDDDDDFEWQRLAMGDDSLTPDMQQAAINGDLDPAEWLRIGNGEDIPPEWLGLIPPALHAWGARPKGYPEDAPWPPPKPPTNPVCRPKCNDVDPDWLQVAFDKKLPPHLLKKAINNELEPAEWLKIGAGDDVDPTWLNNLTDADAPRPSNYPENLPWPPPKPMEKVQKPQEARIRGLRQKKVMQELMKKPAFQGMLNTHDIDPNMLKSEMKKGGTLGVKPKYLTIFPFVKKVADGDIDPVWLEHCFDKNKDKPQEFEVALMDPEPDWLKLGLGDDMDPQWIDLSVEDAPARPANYPDDAPWPPPKPEDPIRIRGIRNRKARQIAQNLADKPAFQELLKNKGLDPQDVKENLAKARDPKLEKIGRVHGLRRDPDHDLDAEMLNFGGDEDLVPELLALCPFLGEAADGEVDPVLLEKAFDRHKDDPELLNAEITGDDEPDWLELACGDDLDPTWVAVLEEDPDAPRPANFPAGAAWPPNVRGFKDGKKKGNGEKDAGMKRTGSMYGTTHPVDDAADSLVPAEWLQVAFDLGANPEALRKAANGEVEPVDWLRLACGEEPDPTWLRTDSLGHFPKTRPEGYPEDMPWPPPKAKGKRRELDPKWIEMAFDKGLQKNTIKRAAMGELDPVEWLNLFCEDDIDPTWVKLSHNGADRPKNYPANLPWPIPQPGATCGRLDPEWIQLLFGQGLPRSVLRRGATDQLDPAEWIKLCSDEDPEPEWLAVDKSGNYAADRPVDYPPTLPWPPPKPFENELSKDWMKLATGNAHRGGRIAGIPSEQLRRAVTGDITPAEWLAIACPDLEDDVPPEWLDKDEHGEYYERPHDYPLNAPWPPPKHRARLTSIPPEWADIAAKEFPEEALRRIADDDFTPADWLKLAADVDEVDPEWLACDAAGQYPEDRPESYPAYLPWPPPKPKLVDNVIDPAWLKLATRKGVRPAMRAKALAGDLEPVEWLKLAIGGEPDPTWLKMNAAGEYPKNPPATYPRHVLPWPPPMPKKKAEDAKAKDLSMDSDSLEPTIMNIGATDDIAAEWMKLAMASDDPEVKTKALRGELEKEDWLKLATKSDDIDPDWLDGDKAAGGRPADYPAHLPWPPPKTEEPEMAGRFAERQEKKQLQWLELAAQHADPKTFKRAVRQELSAAEWLTFANDGKAPPATWLKEPYTAARPSDYPKQNPWPVPLPKDALTGDAWKPDWLDLPPLEDNEAEWLRLALANKDTPPDLKRKALRRELDRADWLKLGRGQERNEDDELPVDWVAIPEDFKFTSDLKIAGTKKKSKRIPRPAGYPKHLPWPPPKSAPKPVEGKELERKTYWLMHALEKERFNLVRRCMVGTITTKDWVQIMMDEAAGPLRYRDPPPPITSDAEWDPPKPKKYPEDAPWPPPRPRPLDEAVDLSWQKISKDEELAGDWMLALLKSNAPYEVKRKAVQLTLPASEYVDYALGATQMDPRWAEEANKDATKVKVRGKDGRPLGYPGHLPWPPPEMMPLKSPSRKVGGTKDDDLRAEWYQNALKYSEMTGRKDVFKQALRGELTAEDWISIGVKTSMGAESPIQTEWLKPGDNMLPPSGYPLEAAWPPLELLLQDGKEKNAVAFQLPTAWLELALEKNLPPQRLLDAQNLRIPPMEWFKLVLDGHPPPPSWLDRRFADSTWPKAPPHDYPKNMPWPPPPHLAEDPRRKRGGGSSEAVGWYSSGARGDKKSPHDAGSQDMSHSNDASSIVNKDNIPVEWLKLAAVSLSGARLQAAYHGDLSAQEWLAVANKGVAAPAHWGETAPKQARERWGVDRPQGYPEDAPWPPPMPREARRRARRGQAGKSQDGVSQIAKSLRSAGSGDAEQVIPQEWLTLAVAYARTRPGTNTTYISNVLNNAVAPSEWLRMALGENDLPTSWLSYVPSQGQRWPKKAPEDFPEHAPWPPPRPKKTPTFQCDVWEDTQDDDDLEIEVVNLPGAMPPPLPAAAVEKKTGVVYFKLISEKEEEQTEKVNFVNENEFQTVQEFRSGVRHFFKFRGGVEQVLLQIRKKGDFMDLDELENNHHWPPPTSSENPIMVTIFDLNKKKGTDKKALKVTGGMLRGLGGRTEMARRAQQVRENGADDVVVGRGGGLSILERKKKGDETARLNTARPSARGPRPGAVDPNKGVRVGKGGGDEADKPGALAKAPKSALKDKRDPGMVPSLGLKFDTTDTAVGLKVTQAGPTAEGVLPGDRILSVDGAPVATVQALNDALSKRDEKAGVAVQIQRVNGTTTTVTLHPAGPARGSLAARLAAKDKGDRKVGFGQATGE